MQIQAGKEHKAGTSRTNAEKQRLNLHTAVVAIYVPVYTGGARKREKSRTVRSNFNVPASSRLSSTWVSYDG